METNKNVIEVLYKGMADEERRGLGKEGVKETVEGPSTPARDMAEKKEGKRKQT